MQQAARVSDRTAFFYLGKLIEYDLTDNIFMNPSAHKPKPMSQDASVKQYALS